MSVELDGANNTVKTDTISEVTSANGVTIDGVALKDGAVTATGVVTGTAFTAGSAVLAEAELELLDGLTAGTAIASKVVTTDSSIDTSGQRNLTISGELDAATLDISGAVDIAGTSLFHERIGVKTAGDLGVGIHVRSADSGGTVSADADELVLENSGNAGVTFLSGASSSGRIFFGDSGAPAIGWIRYFHDSNKMDFGTNDANVLELASGGSVSIRLGIYGIDDANTGIQFDGSDVMTFHTGGTEHFRIAADGTLTGTDTSIGSNSDSRVKENIADFTYDLTKFKQLKPRTFDWKNPSQHNGLAGNRGFIAQEIKAIDDYWVGELKLKDNHADYSLLDSVTLNNCVIENGKIIANGISESDWETGKSDSTYSEDSTWESSAEGDRVSLTSKLGKKDAMYISVINQLITRIEALEA